MFSKFFTLLACISVCSYTQSIAHRDDGAIEDEKHKALAPFNLAPCVEKARAANYDGGDDYPESEEEARVRNDSYENFVWPKSPKKTKAQLLSEKKAEEERQKKIDGIESTIRKGIRKFATDHPSDLVDLKAVFETRKKTDYWADIANAMGDHFKSKNKFEEADYFYDLASKGFLVYTDNSSPSSRGYMNLKRYNDEITTNHPKKPTASLFYHLQKTIAALAMAANHMDEVAGFALGGLIRTRSMIVRWHVSTQGIVNDAYYGHGGLANLVYAKGFVQKVLSEAEHLKVLRKAKRYDGSGTQADLSTHLLALGFYGIHQSHNHHNWVHPNGFMVRVKRLDDGKAQFTVGLTLENPIIWDANGKPSALKRHSDNYPLAFDENNEVLKLAYDGKAVFVVPAFYKTEWLTFWFNRGHIDEMMKHAHFSLPGGFGSKGWQTKAVERLLTF